MRIIFASRPAFGHVFAIAPLARAAQDAGHEVIFASGESFLDRLTSWGFPARPVGGGIEWAFERTSAEYPELLQAEAHEFGARMFVDILGPGSLEDMAVLVQETSPDLVVYEATDVGAAVAASAAGIPVVCHSLSVWIPDFAEAIRLRTQGLWDDVAAPAFDATVGDVLLDIWPPSMQAHDVDSSAKQRLLLRPVTWADPEADIPEWIKDARGPLVFVSLGTVFWGKDLLPKLIEGVAKLDCDALVLAGVDATPDDLPTPNERIHVTGFVNQAEVLRHADVVIHHGGAGTMLGALSRGLPALVLPEGADRPHTAASLNASGAGISLPPRESSADDLAGALRALIEDDRYRTRAQEIKREIEAMPSPEHIVGQLESLLTRG